jgi:hypothetical protein
MKPKERLHRAFVGLLKESGQVCVSEKQFSPALKEMLAAIEALPEVGNEEILEAVNKLLHPPVEISINDADWDRFFRPELPGRKTLQ